MTDINSELKDILDKYDEKITLKDEENKEQLSKVHVHIPPRVTLNETPEEFHIPTRLCQKI
jgi:hypothetical protein